MQTNVLVTLPFLSRELVTLLPGRIQLIYYFKKDVHIKLFEKRCEAKVTSN